MLTFYDKYIIAPYTDNKPCQLLAYRQMLQSVEGNMQFVFLCNPKKSGAL